MAKIFGDLLIENRKLTAYLLNDQHFEGADKARFFRAFGFSRGDVATFAEALERHPLDHEIASEEATSYGIKSTVQCSIVTPDGRNPCICTVWQLDHGSSVHRLITAYRKR